jgi:hypothetical protein
MELIGRGRPIYMIGDSHAVIFRDLVFRKNSQLIVTHAEYCPELYARDFVDARGRLNPMVLASLQAERLVRQNPDGRWQAAHLSRSPNAQSVARLGERNSGAPILVILVGWGDLYHFLKDLGPASDFQVEGSPFDESRFEEPPATANVPWKLVVESAAAVLGPLFQGLRHLEKTGFSKTFLHTLPPQTADDAEFAAHAGFHAPARLRYKVTVLFNAMFREFARQNPEIGLIDTWDSTTLDGQLDPRFLADHWGHLNKEAARVTVDRVLEEAHKANEVSAEAGNSDIERAVREASRCNDDSSNLLESPASLADLSEQLQDLCVEYRDAKQQAELKLEAIEKAAEERKTLLESNEAKFRELRTAYADLQKVAEERLAEIDALTKTAEERLRIMLAYKTEAELLRPS